MAKRKKVRVFGPLKEALEDARAYEKGAKVELRVSELPAPPRRLTPQEIAEIRHALNASQTLFAMLLNVSPKAVQSWEQGVRRPARAALKLLALAKQNPRVLLRA